MDESNKKARHGFVTFWLWTSIVAHAFLAVQQFVTMDDYSRLNDKVILFSIVIIVGNILVLRWKIIGVFIVYIGVGIVTVTIANVPIILYFEHYGLATSIVLGLLIISIYFGILNIKKNGISVWRHLLNEVKANKRETKVLIAGLVGLILFLVIAIFPITRFYDNTIVLFAPERIVRWNHFNGRVLGNHILVTEYGEIRIGYFSPVYIGYGSLYISSEAFEDGYVSHNLVFLGGEMPEHIVVEFNHSHITYFDLNHQDMSIYGVPVRTNGIHVNNPYITADIVFYAGVFFLQEHITLADSTELIVRSVSSLSIYKDEQRWELEDPPGWSRDQNLFVKRSGETEFTAYRSITLKENWGEFIEGEPVEE